MGKVVRVKLGGLLDPHCLLAMAGLALYWPLFRVPFLGTVFSDAFVGTANARLYYDILLGVLGLALLILPSSSRTGRLLLSERTSLVCGASLSVGVAALFLAAFAGSLVQGSALTLAFCVGLLFLAFGFVGLTLQWVHYVGCLPVDRAVGCLGVSFAFSFVLGVLDFSPMLLAVASVIMPFASALLLRVSQRYACLDEDDQQNDERAFAGQGEREETMAFGWAIVGLVGCMIVGLVASTLLRSLWMHGAFGYSASLRLVLTYVVSIVEAIALLLVFSRMRSRRAAAVIGLMLLMVVLLAGIALCAFAGTRYGLGFIASSHTVLEFYLWGFLAVFAGRDRRRALSCFGFFFVIESVKALLAMFILPGILGISEATEADMALALSLSAVGVVALAFVVLATILTRNAIALYESYEKSALRGEENVPRESMPSADEEGEAPFSRGIAVALMRDYALTERESEVAACLARGNSVKRTAELLCLAPSTVQGYTKTIYRKMGITKKQSLIDLVATLRVL